MTQETMVAIDVSMTLFINKRIFEVPGVTPELFQNGQYFCNEMTLDYAGNITGKLLGACIALRGITE